MSLGVVGDLKNFLPIMKFLLKAPLPPKILTFCLEGVSKTFRLGWLIHRTHVFSNQLASKKEKY
jgi:hypothetical protein